MPTPTSSPTHGRSVGRESMPGCLYPDPTKLFSHGLRGLCPEKQYLICLEHQMRPSVEYTNAGICKEHVICWNLCNSSPQPFWHQGPASWKIIFPGTGVEGLVWGWLKHITFIVRFISIMITSRPPHSIRHEILESGDPSSTASHETGCLPSLLSICCHPLWSLTPKR